MHFGEVCVCAFNATRQVVNEIDKYAWHILNRIAAVAQFLPEVTERTVKAPRVQSLKLDEHIIALGHDILYDKRSQLSLCNRCGMSWGPRQRRVILASGPCATDYLCADELNC